MTTKTQFIKFFIFSMLFLMIFFKVYSQTDALSVRRDDNGKIKFARFLQSENSERKMTNGVTFLKSKLQLDDRDEFRLISEMTNKSGITTKRFQQYYKGIKVEEAQYVLRGRNDIITSMNGDFQDINLPTVEPVFSEQQATRTIRTTFDIPKSLAKGSCFLVVRSGKETRPKGIIVQ